VKRVAKITDLPIILQSQKLIMKRIFLPLFLLIASTKVYSQKAHINHTAIYVVDVKTSAGFYRDIIGLDTIPEPFHDDKHAWFKTGQGIALHIIQGADVKKEYYKNQHTCFSVASVDDFISALQKNKIPWEDRDGTKMAVTTRIDGVKQIWLQDPDGYWIEINDAKD
jgi:lactoylglutathione lyase